MPILVVIWTMLSEGFHVQRIPLEAPRVIECSDLLWMVGVAEICAHQAVECEITHNSSPCRRRWLLQEGMKFVIDIRPAVEPGEESCSAMNEVVDNEDSVLMQHGAACGHARQNLITEAILQGRRRHREWSYHVWWHPQNHRGLNSRVRTLHLRRADCAECQLQRHLSQELEGEGVVLTAVWAAESENEYRWSFVARSACQLCQVLLIRYQEGLRVTDGTIMLGNGRDDFTVEAVFNIVFPCNRCAESQDCWLIDPLDWVWFWGSFLDVPEGTLLKMFLEDREELNNHIGSEGCEENTATSAFPLLDEPLNVIHSMVQEQHTYNNENDHEALDEWSSMQTHSRLKWDSGHTSISAHHFQYCVDNQVAWCWPIRLRYRELYWAWHGSQFDFVRTQMLDMKVPLSDTALTGWIFRDPQQILGDEFSWGMLNDLPWSLQISRLMRSSSLQDSLLYTVCPQPEEPTGLQAASLHLVVPWEGMPPMLQVIVVEHRLHGVVERKTVACSEHCTVLSIVQALFGFMGRTLSRVVLISFQWFKLGTYKELFEGFVV